MSEEKLNPKFEINLNKPILIEVRHSKNCFWDKRVPVAFVNDKILCINSLDSIPGKIILNNIDLVIWDKWRLIEEKKPEYVPFTQETVKPYLDYWCKYIGSTKNNYTRILRFNVDNVYLEDNFCSYIKFLEKYIITKDFINYQHAGVLNNEI